MLPPPTIREATSVVSPTRSGAPCESMRIFCCGSGKRKRANRANKVTAAAHMRRGCRLSLFLLCVYLDLLHLLRWEHLQQLLSLADIWLCLFLLFGLLPCFPRGVFPLPVLTLKECLNLWKKDAGEGFYLVIGNTCTVIIGLFLARHGITPL